MAENKFVLQDHQGGPAGMGSAPVPLTFQRIVDVPLETCLAALDSGQEPDGELRFGESRLVGPVEHDGDMGTCRLEVRLARGRLRPALRMRLDVDRWSSSSTALELIPCGRVRPTAAYFRAGHLLLDAVTRSLAQHRSAAAARDEASRARILSGSGPAGTDEVRFPPSVTANAG